jgi:hypothetical protein
MNDGCTQLDSQASTHSCGQISSRRKETTRLLPNTPRVKCRQKVLAPRSHDWHNLGGSRRATSHAQAGSKLATRCSACMQAVAPAALMSAMTRTASPHAPRPYTQSMATLQASAAGTCACIWAQGHHTAQHCSVQSTIFRATHKHLLQASSPNRMPAVVAYI